MELIPVIQCIIIWTYTVIYINIWPIFKPGTIEQYKAMLFWDVVVIVIMFVTGAPKNVLYILSAVAIKDLVMVFRMR